MKKKLLPFLLSIFLLACFFSNKSFAITTGIYTIGSTGNYTSFNAAITALNAGISGSAGTVTFNVAPEIFNETSTLVINAISTSSYQVVFQAASGNPVINFSIAAGGTTDAGILLSGTDYITFKGITINDNGTTDAERIENGFALTRASGTDGCNHVIIKNCTIDLTKTNANLTAAIYQRNNTAATSSTGAHQNNSFCGNTITDTRYGIYMMDLGATFFDANNFVGMDEFGNPLGNTITFAGTAVSGAIGIGCFNTGMTTIANNIIRTDIGTTSNNVWGIYGGNGDIYNNDISLSSDGTSGGFYLAAIYLKYAGTVSNVYNNNIHDCTNGLSGAPTMAGIKTEGTYTTLNIYGNNIHDNHQRGNVSGAYFEGMELLGGIGEIMNVYNNHVHDNTSTSHFRGISFWRVVFGSYSDATTDVHDNIIEFNSGVSATVAGTTGGDIIGIFTSPCPTQIYKNQINNFQNINTGNVYGIYGGCEPTLIRSNDIHENQVYNLTSSAGNAAGIFLYQAYVMAAGSGGMSTYTVYNNTVHTISTSASGISSASGILIDQISSPVNAVVYTNSISDISTSASTSTTSVSGINNFAGGTMDIHDNTINTLSSTGGGATAGINLASGSTSNLYNNNVHDLTSAVAGAAFGINITGGTTQIINNNTLNNISTSGTGMVAAINNSANSTLSIHDNIINTLSSIAGTVSGISVSAGITVNTFLNTINNISSSSIINGINITGGTTLNTYQNTINAFSSTGGGLVSGINLSAGSIVNTYNNKIYNLNSSTVNGKTFGINLTGGTTNTVYNNMVSDLRTPMANSGNAVTGLYLTGGTTIYVYYNSVYLSNLTSSSSTTFGTSGIYTNTASNITLKNNLVVNKSISSGTGLTVGHRRNGNSVSNLTSDYNSYYAALVGYDGTTNYTSLPIYQGWATSESHSISVDPGFFNLSDLHQVEMNFAGLIQLKGTPIAGIAPDIDGDNRNSATFPDIGYDEVLNPLPIQLLNFSGKDQGETNLLQWTTATEINNDYFTLERSINGKTFESIAIIDGAGNSTTALNYNFSDKLTSNNQQLTTIYYRLKQTDFNGDYNYAQMIVIQKNKPKNNIEFTGMYPNPATDNFNYTLTSSEETEISLSIIDVLGREVSNSKFQVSIGVNNFNMNLTMLSKGSYFVQIGTPSGSFKEQKQLIVK